jgi:hypothetical protein
MGKAARSGLATGLLPDFDPLPPRKRRGLAFPFSLQTLVLFSQLLQEPLQAQDLHSLMLVAGTFSHQLQLQFSLFPLQLGDALIEARPSRRRFFVRSAHETKSTGFGHLSIESFGLISSAV